MQTAKMPKGRRARWIMYLQQFEFEIIHRPGKENSNADALSRTNEIMCNFVGTEILQEEEGTLIQTQLEPEEPNYEGDSEDNEEDLLKKYTYTNEFSTKLMESIRKEMKEIEKLQVQRQERYEKLQITVTQIKAKTDELLGKSSRKRKKCTEISNNGSDDESETLSRQEPTEDSDDEVAQENESYYSAKHAEDIISYYEESVEVANENGWGPEYYANDTVNEAWGLPDLSDEHEQQIEEEWGFWSKAWTYTHEEVTRLKIDILETKWVIANQPIAKGRWSCDPHCDTENHHLHSWCTVCLKRIDHEDKLDHNCKFGFGLGQIHPDMDPQHLDNTIFWKEPPDVIREENEQNRHQTHLQTIVDINLNHQKELNGEGTSRTPLINKPTKTIFGKRFKRY
jgi:hypothetical protein